MTLGEALAAVAAFWGTGLGVGIYLSRYVARRVAYELRLMAFGDPRRDPRRR